MVVSVPITSLEGMILLPSEALPYRNYERFKQPSLDLRRAFALPVGDYDGLRPAKSGCVGAFGYPGSSSFGLA